MRRRLLVFSLAFAMASAAPPPSRADERLDRGRLWSADLESRAWGTTTDRFGVVVSSGNGSVRAFDRHGLTRWTTYVPGPQDGNPAITRSRVLVGRTGRAVALARRDGTVEWEQPMDDHEVPSVALAGDVAIAGDASGTLRAFDAASGRPRWSVHHEGALRAAARVDADSGSVLAAWADGAAPAVRVLDLETGAERWRQPVDEFSAAPQLADGRAFVASGDGHYHAWVAAFDLRSGEVGWKMTLPASFASNIVPAADTHDLVVADWVGNVSSIDPANGTPRWSTALGRYITDARVVLFTHRVAITTVDGALFVLDRGSGAVVVHAEPRELDGWAGALAPFGRDALLVALWAVHPPRIEVHRVP